MYLFHLASALNSAIWEKGRPSHTFPKRPELCPVFQYKCVTLHSINEQVTLWLWSTIDQVQMSYK